MRTITSSLSSISLTRAAAPRMHVLPYHAATSSTQRRSILLQPEHTVDPARFPLGYAPVTDGVSADTAFELVRQGHYVAADDQLATTHRLYMDMYRLVEGQREVRTYDDFVAQQMEKLKLQNLLLVSRRFWEYSDFTDPEMNRAYGLQAILFDSYAWSHKLWREFQAYVERHYPVSEHTHLTYFEYTQLLRYFAYAYNGVDMRPLLPTGEKLRPLYGVPVPRHASRAPWALYSQWLAAFQRPYGINKALVVRSGCGALALCTRRAGVRMVRGVDPDPRCVESARNDAQRLAHTSGRNVQFMVSDLLPPPESKERYDMIVFSPDSAFLQMHPDALQADEYAPTLQGFQGELEHFFERAADHLTERGIIVVAMSSFFNIAFPGRPHPVEAEIRGNRRWMLLDYIDAKASGKAVADLGRFGGRVKLARDLAEHLRAEVWVLHRVEALAAFGWAHGMPGAAPPAHVAAQWSGRALQRRRMRQLRRRVMADGADWGDFKGRMLRAMELEDATGDVAADAAGATTAAGGDDAYVHSLRLSIDPAYAARVERKAEAAAAAAVAARHSRESGVLLSFPGDESPRAAHEREMQAALARAAAARSAGGVKPTKSGRGSGRPSPRVSSPVSIAASSEGTTHTPQPKRKDRSL